jgi:membrane-bound lytic murein transglycosylase B
MKILLLFILVIVMVGCRTSEPMAENTNAVIATPEMRELARNSSFLRSHPIFLTSAFAPLSEPLLKAGLDTSALITFLSDPDLKFQESLVKINVTGYRKKADYSHNYNAYSIKKCRQFMEEHFSELQAASQRYGVMPEVITAILWVETKFGTITGKHYLPSVFFTIALAAEPANIERNKQALRQESPAPPDSELIMLDQKIEQRARKKADWALREILALDTLRRIYPADFHSLHGSTAGAFGWSQFLPSSYLRWSADGDGDGVRDLFNKYDAIASVANYLKSNGWGPDRQAQEKAVFHYNNSRDYVDAVLTLAVKIQKD